MRKILLVILMIFTAGYIYAQLGKVAGKVVDAESGKPVPVVEVSIGDFKTITDDKGNFELVNIPAGKYLISFSSESYDLYTMEINVAEGENNLNEVSYKPKNALLNESGGLSEVNLSNLDFDDESKGQNISGLLHSSSDIFSSTSSYSLSALYFRPRGYDGENSLTYMNNILVNDAESGRTMWADWGGLNDATRNKESVIGLSASDFSFGNIGGVTNIDTRASHYRKQNKLSYAYTNKAYTHRIMYTLSTGLMKNNWAFTLSGSRRYAEEGYVQGTFYDAWAYFGAAEKKLNENHSLAFTFYGAPIKRGMQSASTKEVYELTGNNYYNANWGYINGEKRNARIKTTNEPTFILNHYFKLDDKTKLTTSLGYSIGKNGYTALNWYNSPDPRPDYYRYLPSYQSTRDPYNPPDPLVVNAITEAWKNNTDINQLDWEKLYQANHYANLSGKQAAYILENRHNDQNQISFNSFLNKEANEHLNYTAGIELRKYTSKNYKTIEDMLGGSYWIDIDQFSARDFTSDTNVYFIMQNDMNNPNRSVKTGDIYGYNYDININTGLLWGQAEFSYNKIDFYLAARISSTQFWREGKMRNGINPDNSFGNSEKKNFINYAAKGGFTYKINGKNYIVGNVAYITKPPSALDAFVSSRIKNSFLPGLTSEKIFSTDLSYILRTPKTNTRLTVYYTKFKDQLDVVHSYHDDYETYINCSMTGIDKTHKGIELGSEIKVTKTISLIAVGAYGDYRIDNRPSAVISYENGLKADINDTIYYKNFFVAGTPQIAGSFGIKYAHPKFWWFNVNLNYFDKMYLSYTPFRRTKSAVEGLTYDDPKLQSITEPEKLPAGYTIDASISKSIRLNYKYYININLNVNNILDNQNLFSGGYEQSRFNYEDKAIDKFPPRYFYAFGRSYFLGVSFRI